jgi:hypothetical protein
LAAAGQANNENWTSLTFGTATVVTDNCTNGDADNVFKTDSATITGANNGWAAGERGAVRLERDPDGSGDTYNFDAEALAVRICYPVTNVFSGQT